MYLGSVESATSEQIASALASLYRVSKATLARDLQELVKSSQIEVEGIARSTKYRLKFVHPLLKQINLDSYFVDDPDNRIGAQKVLMKRFLINCQDCFQRQKFLT